jgi:hypothetical protein
MITNRQHIIAQLRVRYIEPNFVGFLNSNDRWLFVRKQSTISARFRVETQTEANAFVRVIL